MASKSRRSRNRSKRNDDDDDVVIIDPPPTKKARQTAPPVASLPPRSPSPSVVVLHQKRGKATGVEKESQTAPPVASLPPRSPSPSVVVLHQKRGKATGVEKESQNSGEESLATNVPPMDNEEQPTPQPDPPPPPPPPAAASPEVVELQQKLAKTESQFQRACRIARQEQLRAERAEGLLDTKSGIVADKKKAEDARTAQIEKLKKDLALVSAQLKVSKEANARESRKLVKANEALNREAAELRRVCQNGYAENEQLKERIGFLTYQLEVSQGRAEADRARIDHLSYRLSQYEQWTHQQNDYWHQNNSRSFPVRRG